MMDSVPWLLPVILFFLRPQEQACLLEIDILEYMPACRGVKRLSGQGHRLRLAFSPSTGLCLCVYLAVPQKGQFTVFQLVGTDNNRYSLEHISSLFSTLVSCMVVGLLAFGSTTAGPVCSREDPRAATGPENVLKREFVGFCF